jgi:Zn-dependent protease
MLERGSLTVARLRAVPIRLHWTLPLGALLFSGFSFAPGSWLGFFLLVLLHELGHAAIVRAFRLRVVGIDITGFGGLCHWSGVATPTQRGAIAWGGVLAQAALLVVTTIALVVGGSPTSRFAGEMASVFTFTNLWLIGINLLPIPPLDGHEAWAFARRILRNRARSAPKRPLSPESRADAATPNSEGMRQLARMLEKIGDEAGKARRS